MPFHIDANDEIYQVAAASDYNPTPGLDKISAPVLTIDSADDERNPTETGLMAEGLKHVRDAHFLLVPASAHTHGHNTMLYAHFYAHQLAAFLTSAPQRLKHEISREFFCVTGRSSIARLASNKTLSPCDFIQEAPKHETYSDLR